jgi:hypothetical protein
MMAWGLFRQARHGFDNFHTMHRELFADQIVCAFEIVNRHREQRKRRRKYRQATRFFILRRVAARCCLNDECFSKSADDFNIGPDCVGSAAESEAVA